MWVADALQWIAKQYLLEHFLRDIITAGAAQCNECEQSDYTCQSWLKGIFFPGRVEQHCPFSDIIISLAFKQHSSVAPCINGETLILKSCLVVFLKCFGLKVTQ